MNYASQTSTSYIAMDFDRMQTHGLFLHPERIEILWLNFEGSSTRNLAAVELTHAGGIR